MSFTATVLSPERVVLEEEVEAVVLRTDVGDATFLTGHMALVGGLVAGPVRFQHEGGTEQRVAVHGGVVQVDGSHVLVLAPVAERAEEIDLERARRALEAAEGRLGELVAVGRSGTGGEPDVIAERELAEAEAAVGRARVRVEVAGG